MASTVLALDSPGSRAKAGTLGLAFVAMAASGPGQSVLIAVFVDEMLSGTGLSRTIFSILYAAGTVVSALTMLLVGRLADRVGPRLVWVLASVGLASACALAGAATGFALAFLALAFLRTFGQGSFPLLATLLVARTFRGYRGRAMAVASSGLTMSSIFLPPLAVALIVAYGWRAAYVALGAALVVLVLPLAAFVDSAGSHAAARVSMGRGTALFPGALRASRTLPRLTVPSPRAGRLLFVMAAPPLVITAIVFHAVSVLGERGLSFAQAGLALGALGVAKLAGTVLGGGLADRLLTRTLLSGMVAVLTLGVVVLLVPSGPTAYLAVLLLGIASGIFGVVAGIVWPRTYGLAEIGRLQGMTASVQIGAAALGPLPLAVSEAATGSYTAGLVALTAYSGVTLVVALRWRDPRVVRLQARSV
ncbi:MAG: MFS transporter [Gaiellaceae bacterium]